MYPKDSVFMVTVIIEKDEDAFHVHSPDLKGLHICAETREEALNAAAHGTIAYLETMIDQGLPIPSTVVQHKPRKRTYRVRRNAEIHNLLLPRYEYLPQARMGSTA